MNKTKLVRGQGVYEKGTYKVAIDGRMTKEYRLWDGVLGRCQPSRQLVICRKSYIGCSVHPDFIKFQDFAAWCQNQIGFGNDGWALDKDILVPGNKVYGPDTCVFVPAQINTMLTYKQNHIGADDYPVGVCLYRNGKFMAAIRVDGKTKTLGYFETPEAAHDVYKIAKLKAIHHKADIYKDVIDPRVYTALKAHRIDSK